MTAGACGIAPADDLMEERRLGMPQWAGVAVLPRDTLHFEDYRTLECPLGLPSRRVTLERRCSHQAARSRLSTSPAPPCENLSI